MYNCPKCKASLNAFHDDDRSHYTRTYNNEITSHSKRIASMLLILLLFFFLFIFHLIHSLYCFFYSIIFQSSLFFPPCQFSSWSLNMMFVLFLQCFDGKTYVSLGKKHTNTHRLPDGVYVLAWTISTFSYFRIIAIQLLFANGLYSRIMWEKKNIFFFSFEMPSFLFISESLYNIRIEIKSKCCSD